MARYSNEFWVGLLSIGAAAMVAWGITQVDDRPDGGGRYFLVVEFPAVDGVFPDTPVKVAGVPVGAVEKVELVGGQARLLLMMQGNVQLPTDTVAELKADGLLGDKMVRLVPGKEGTLLKDGDSLKTGEEGSSIDALTAKLGAIADDVKVITGGLRKITGDEAFQQRVLHIVDNVDGLSTELRDMARDNRSELNQIAANLLEVSRSLKAVVEGTGSSVEAELAAVRVATESLTRTLGNLESISGKIDRGDGTIGALVNDRTPMDKLNATLTQVNEVVEDVNDIVADASRIRTDVTYRGNFYFGSNPNEPGFAQNPMSGSFRNTLGIRIQPREDYWYEAAFVSHPLGTITKEESYFPELDSSFTEYTRRPDYRFSFQFAKRFDNLVLRFGIKESSGGIGADYLLFRDRFAISADLYDFEYGSWPVLDGTPNLAMNLRAWPWRFLYLEAGADNIIFGAQHGYFTGYAGAGFTFNDQDLRLILPALPTP
jgi:phospholipid/cholesterol/gamma-HCH transport system substrate-binding protein